MALARALVREPKVLLLDEPLGALDKRLREAMQVELRAIQRKVGITFLLVTHDQEEALSLSDRVAVMSGGRILQVAAPRTLYERPNCREVADFIGEMNFFHATVREIAGDSATVNAGHAGHRHPARAPIWRPASRRTTISCWPSGPSMSRFADAGVAGEIAAATFLGERSHFHVQIAGRSEPVCGQRAARRRTGAVHLAFPPESSYWAANQRD